MSEVANNAPNAVGTVPHVAAKSNWNFRMNWFIVEILLNIMQFLMKCCQSCSLAFENAMFFSLFQNFTAFCHFFLSKNVRSHKKNAPHAAGTVAPVAAKSNWNFHMNWFIA